MENFITKIGRQVLVANCMNSSNSLTLIAYIHKDEKYYTYYTKEFAHIWTDIWTYYHKSILV